MLDAFIKERIKELENEPFGVEIWKMVNYEKEWETIQSEVKAEVFKPKEGAYIIKIVEEPEETFFEDKKDGSKTPQLKIKIRVSGQDKDQVWYVSKGKTSRSLYGQLIALGKGENGLAGKQIQLLVKPSKNQAGQNTNDYTIVEAIKYLKTTEEKVN